MAAQQAMTVSKPTNADDSSDLGPMSPASYKVAEELRDRYTIWESMRREFLTNASEDLDFLAGDHYRGRVNGEWVDMAENLRRANRTAMTIDLLQPSVDLIVNQARINKSTPNFIPVGDGADKATAEIRQGLYRNIDRESNAAVARETAYQMAVSCGEGAYRVLIEDEPGLTMDKRIKIQRIDNLNCYAHDATCLEFDDSDMEWCAFWDTISQEEFASEVGPDSPIEATGLSLPEPQRSPWFDNVAKRVRRIEYFRRVWKDRTVYKLKNGKLCWKEDAPKPPPEYDAVADPMGIFPVSYLVKPTYTIERFKMTGSQVIKKYEWPGRYMPLIVVKGREVFRGSRPNILQGMVHPAKDLVRANNFAFSRLIDEVALSPLPHMFAATGTLTVDQQAVIKDINRHAWSVVMYDAKLGQDGQPLPRPEWVSFSPNISAIVAASVHSKDSLQRVLNTYAPQLGSLQADQSGRAINSVREQGDISHAQFPDNLSRALQYEARVVNDLMGHVYTDERAIFITDPDEETRKVLINTKGQVPNGQDQHFLFTTGQYDVVTVIGPSGPTRQQEAATRLIDAMKFLPQLAQVAPDLVIRALNIPGGLGPTIEARIKPPNAQDENAPPIPQEVQQKLAQYARIVELQTKAIEEMRHTIETKQPELESKERIAFLNAMVQLKIAANKTGSEENMVELEHYIQLAESALDRQHEAALQQQQLAAQPAAEGADQGQPPNAEASPETPVQ